MRKAFTLVEVLVVIVVIALLAALLFPVYAKARKQAHRVHCTSNLRQLWAAINTYTQDWDNRYPAVHNTFQYTQGKQPILPQVMGAYVSDDRLWRCPADTGEVFGAGGGFHRRTPPMYQFQLTSYYYTGTDSGTGQLGGVEVSAVKRPSIAPLLWDIRPWHGNPAWSDQGRLSPEKMNVLHCDGHIDHRTWQEWLADLNTGMLP
jgi:prepilin-type N-terminal cleavage/methylation domain-containing protein